jgi:hypothetical protein
MYESRNYKSDCPLPLLRRIELPPCQLQMLPTRPLISNQQEDDAKVRSASRLAPAKSVASIATSQAVKKRFPCVNL